MAIVSNMCTWLHPPVVKPGSYSVFPPRAPGQLTNNAGMAEFMDNIEHNDTDQQSGPNRFNLNKMFYSLKNQGKKSKNTG